MDKELDDIMKEKFYHLVMEKSRSSSVDEAKTDLFKIFKEAGEELKSRGFCVNKNFPKHQEDIPDGTAENFLTTFDDYFRKNVKVNCEVARRET